MDVGIGKLTPTEKKTNVLPVDNGFCSGEDLQTINLQESIAMHTGELQFSA